MNDTLADFLNLLGLALSTVALVGWLCTTDVFSRGKQTEENAVPQTECTTTATP